MALWEFSHRILGLFEYLGVVGLLIDDFVGEGASPYVIPTVTVMNFLHHLPSLLQTKASQIQVWVETGVGFFV